MNQLILIVGLPRSGKSTRAREMTIRLNAPIVNPDAIRRAIHGEAYIQTAEPHVWATAFTMVRSLFLAGHDTVIVDGCNNTKKRRREWKCYDGLWEIATHSIDTSVSECLKRAKGNSQISSVIERMYRQHEAVIPDELKQLNS